MGSHPLNLAVRFILELVALFSVGRWAWQLFDTPLNYILVILTPLTFATIWGVFAVPNDPSRSGKAPVPTPGFLRLFIELVLFGFSVWAMKEFSSSTYALTFALIIGTHYVLSYDRIKWLIKNQKKD